MLLEKIAVKSLNDYWIFTGLAQYLADMYLMLNSSELFAQHVFESKKRVYYQMVKNGKDVNPLNLQNFMHPAEAVLDTCYNLKCCLVFHLIQVQIKV